MQKVCQNTVFPSVSFLLRTHLYDEGKSLMQAAMSQRNLSARPIADLAGCEEIESGHLAEVLHASHSTELQVRQYLQCQKARGEVGRFCKLQEDGKRLSARITEF